MIEFPQTPNPPILERALPKPILQLRTHHLLLDEVAHAILGATIDTSEIIPAYRNMTSRQYKTDTIGTTVYTEQKFLQGHTELYAKLATLGEDDWIELSLSADDLCKGCSIGKHCTAVNFTMTDDESPNDIMGSNTGEEQIISNLIEDFQNAGAREFADFIRVTTSHFVHNYNGTPLSEQNFTATTIKFRGALVRVGTLRKLLDPDGLHRNYYKLASLNASSTQG